jgi:hypothetical protein
VHENQWVSSRDSRSRRNRGGGCFRHTVRVSGAFSASTRCVPCLGPPFAACIGLSMPASWDSNPRTRKAPRPGDCTWTTETAPQRAPARPVIDPGGPGFLDLDLAPAIGSPR